MNPVFPDWDTPDHRIGCLDAYCCSDAPDNIVVDVDDITYYFSGQIRNYTPIQGILYHDAYILGRGYAPNHPDTYPVDGVLLRGEWEKGVYVAKT